MRFSTANGHFAFLNPSLGGLGATYHINLRLIGKRVVDSLLVIIERLRRYERKSIENWRFRRNGASLPPNFIHKILSYTTILRVEKLDEWSFYVV